MQDDILDTSYARHYGPDNVMPSRMFVFWVGREGLSGKEVIGMCALIKSSFSINDLSF